MLPELPAEAVQAAARANSEHYEVCGERDCGRCTMIYNAARRGLDAALRVMAGVGSPTSCPSTAPESTHSPESPSAAPVYPPGPASPTGTLSALRNRYAAAMLAHLPASSDLSRAVDAVLAVRDDELARALRIADYHAGLHRQAADILARLFPSIECVLIDHADELGDEQGRVDANLAELAHVYRELTGFDARAAASEEQTGGQP